MNVAIRRTSESRELAMPLKGKVAIVIDSGVGQAIVLELARLHANVVIYYVCHPDAIEALEQQVRKLGDQSRPALRGRPRSPA
jgi:NAD(P)-dependent dehydrogenase (short-subunit alcohol dehydrogenase family)